MRMIVCDRCEAVIKEPPFQMKVWKKNGPMTRAELCPKCHVELKTWLTPPRAKERAA